MLNVFNTLTVLEVLTLRKPKKNVKTRNVVLKIESYKRLEQYKVDLMKERVDSSVTFDDAIITLLEEHYDKKPAS